MSLGRRIFAERRSVLVPLIALLVIDGLLIAGGLLPLKRVVTTDTAAAEASRFNTALSTQRLRQMQNARSSRDRAEKELATFYGQVLPANQPAASRLAMLEVAKLARENNLALKGRTWEDEPLKDGGLQRLTTKVELVGDYAAIRRFLYDVETSEAFLAILSVQLSQAALATQQQNTGQLQLAVEIATYYRTGATK